ncbi:MAG TPA: aminotransferase class III-fold pyridoxal phosphate-dependent enzyme [Streptosporangiaceae bacterium]
MTTHGCENSAAWRRRARRVLPDGAQTAAKSPGQWPGGGSLPAFLRRASGGHVWDVDGNEWVDFPMALGPVLLGHADPAVARAIAAQLRDGISFTLMHPLEVEVAERIAALCPGVQTVWFTKTGSEATAAAIRLARARTGRERILSCGYHGWHDWYAAGLPQVLGVPGAARPLVASFPFNDLGVLERELSAGDVAAVIVEPTGAVLPEPGFLDGVVSLARRAGAVSVFDEMISGFRIAAGGAREKYAVIPDLSCYGKALGNGMPIAAVAGRREMFRDFDRAYISGTYAGETLSLAAARVVLDTIASGEALATIAAAGQRLQALLGDCVTRHQVSGKVSVGGEPARPVVRFGQDRLLAKSWAQQCLAEEGVLFNGVFNMCLRHTEEDIRLAVAGFDRACAGLADGDDLAGRLRGPLVAAEFRPV